MKIIENGSVTTPAGFQAAGVAAGIKKKGSDRLDLALVVSDTDCAAAGVFTQNLVVAAPVLVCKETLAESRDRMRAVVVNAGNANACTGEPGLAAAGTMQQVTGIWVGCEPQQVLPMSTGVIGVQLPMDVVSEGIRAAAERLSPTGGETAAHAIMTTDTRPKHQAIEVALSGGKVSLGGMVKGAGMIHPNMATMLGLITTDALIPAGTLQAMLLAAANKSFNCISIDGDTSTNDTVLMLANGASGVSLQNAADEAAFVEALEALCIFLAQAVVRDGEGVTKFVEIRVSGADTETSAHQVANTIATSPLVKTAFAGSDANWGRISAAAGRAGVYFDAHKLALWISKDKKHWLQLMASGQPTDYAEADAAEIFAATDIAVHLDLAHGSAAATVWTCDLTHDYVSINADYRT
ncbi:MAG: bifunctional glutamate N-acetyltransferase/amino-acid acetyltransferase ArgJ [Anaerolineales bacterium]|nr:bifunctional glutamate N-acetyltransferase/amino-acid acetyltransferase ArgJ [Anaerolineales bacterium]